MLSTPLFFNFHSHHFAHNHIVDFSSHLLFEATGDSEADSLADLGGSSIATLNSNSAEFNDAESCTDDTPAFCGDFVRDENEDEEEEEMFENDEVVESKPIGFTTKSSASVDSKEFKMLNEVDKNRLFWETCLAS